MTAGSKHHTATPHALLDDETQPSIETVIANLTKRSEAERQALLKALHDGDYAGTGAGAVSALELTSTGDTPKARLMKPQSASDLDTPPVSGTIPPKIAANTTAYAKISCAL